MNEYKNLGKNTLLITLGNFSSKILSFLLVPMYTAVLSTEDYGISDLITTTINLIIPFFTLLMGEAVMRFALEKSTDNKQVFSIGIWISCIGFLIACISVPWFLFNSVLKKYWIYFLILYFTTVLHTVVSQFAKGIEKVTTYTINGVIGTFTFILFNILFLVVMKCGINGYLMAHILSNAASLVYMFIKEKLWKYCTSLKKINYNVFKDMVTYSVPLIPNSMSWWLSNSAGKYIVTTVCGVAMNGIYSIASKIPTIFSVFSNIFISAWQISAVNTFGTKEAEEFYSRIYKLYNIFNVLLVSVMISFTKLLARFLFSGEFYEAWFFVPILLMGSLFHSIGAFLGTIYTSAKKTKTIFITTLMGAIINIALNFILVYRIGAMGAAISALVSYFVIWVVRLIDSRKILKMQINLVKDLLSYILLVVQCIATCTDYYYSPVITLIILVVIIFVNIRMIKDVVSVLLSKLVRRK